MRPEETSDPIRKLQVSPNEFCQESDYHSDKEATTLLVDVTQEWAANGILVVPTLKGHGEQGSYRLEVHSDHELDVQRIQEGCYQTVTDKWAEGTAGGCHLHPEFKKNPKWVLKFTDYNQEPLDLQITLKRPYNDWSKQCRMDLVGSMMGFYLFRGGKPVPNGDIFHEGKPWNESPFVPLHQVQTPMSFRLPPPAPEENDVYTIVPTTFEPGKKGPLFLSVISNKEFTLKKDTGTKKG